MQIRRLYYGVKGFGKLTDYALRWSHMITEKAKHKMRVLVFWGKFGLAVTIEAFKIKERTLYNWKAQLKKGQGQAIFLNEKSKSPKNKRKRNWSILVKDEIRKLRDDHPNLEKEKVHIFLTSYCQTNNLKCPSISTVGNLIRDMGGLRKFPTKVSHNGTIVKRKRAKIPRKPKDFKAEHIGNCIAFDTIEKIVHGNRRYIITMIDLFSRFSLAWSTTSHASMAARDFSILQNIYFHSNGKMY